jgi:acetate kinase
MRICVLNPGSSTLKASVVLVGTDADPAVESATTIEWPAGTEGADGVVCRALDQLGAAPEAVGYRVVHGGPEYQAPTRIDNQLIDAIERLDVLARLHNRRAAAVMRFCLAELPDLPHVACFDTAFHATLPEEAWRYPLPAEWVERFGIRRYGFHGLSVGWAARRAAELLRQPPDQLGLVVAHLGSGCSVTAVQGGRSVDTSMGFTPLEGLMMGTRAGSVDPGILLHLASHGIAADELAEGLAGRSGLMAVASSYDVRELERRSSAGDTGARLALQMFARRAAAAIAAATTSLDRLDGLVFTGGIGEHAVSVRHAVLTRLSVLGLPARPGDALPKPDGVLHPGPPAVVVVAAREELVVGEAVAALVGDKPPANA